METALDKDYIVYQIQQVLNKVHANERKRKINLKHDRLTFACPICGDSHKDMSQKRGHLFFNNLYYKCYNEDCRSNFTKLCKLYDVQIDPSKKLELINYIDLNFHKSSSDEWLNGSLDKLIKWDDFINWFEEGNGPLKGFKPVTFGSKVYTYLINRGIPSNAATTLFYEGLKIHPKWSEPYIVFVNKVGDKVLGMQERNLLTGDKRRFKIWKFEDLYTSIYKSELDSIEAIPYNKLSYLYNILNINFEKEITAFEGYIDSIFMPNSIGAVGINTDFSFLTREDIDVDLRFFFDNDNIGYKKSYQWLKKGYKVFIWQKLINDLAKEHKDVYKFKIWFKNEIKDLNNLMKHYNLNPKELNKYFSNSMVDILYLPFEKKKKQEEKVNDLHNVNWEQKINQLRHGARI